MLFWWLGVVSALTPPWDGRSSPHSVAEPTWGREATCCYRKVPEQTPRGNPPRKGPAACPLQPPRVLPTSCPLGLPCRSWVWAVPSALIWTCPPWVHSILPAGGAFHELQQVVAGADPLTSPQDRWREPAAQLGHSPPYLCAFGLCKQRTCTPWEGSVGAK